MMASVLVSNEQHVDNGCVNGHIMTDVDVSDPDPDHRVCRDFLRNVCQRGRWCRFKHPDTNEVETKALTMGRSEVTFCHDYQNKLCSRTNCRFLHCTREEEEMYKSSGELPRHLVEAALRKGMLTQDFTLAKGEIPLCKDFLKGHCVRSSKCKFRHLTAPELESWVRYTSTRDTDRWEQVVHMPAATVEMMGMPEPKRPRLEEAAPTPAAVGYNPGGLVAAIHSPATMVQVSGPPPPASALAAAVVAATAAATGAPNSVSSQSVATTPTAALAAALHVAAAAHQQHHEVRVLEEENLMLRQKVEELKKQVTTLTATNEFLLDQNAQLRMASKQVTSNVTTVSLPTVTITNSPLPAAAGVSTVQVTPLVTPIAVPAAQTVAAPPGSAQSTAPPAGTPVVATVATVPVSIAPAPPPTLTAVPVTITRPPPSPQVGPPLGAGPPMSMSGATASLISYPIMTQAIGPPQ